MSDRRSLAFLAGLWTLAVIVAGPRGESALNDDWAYRLPVRSLIEHGRLQLTNWQSVALLPQFAWGALFCVPFGFSFTALRVSTLILGGLGLYATYRLLRDRKVSAEAALCATLTLLCNPIYFALSNSFMSDVPFLCVAVASAIFFQRHLDRASTSDLVWATLLAAVATLIRPLGLALPLAYLVTTAFMRGTRWRFVAALVSCAVVVVVLRCSTLWIEHAVGLPATYDVRDVWLRQALNDLARMRLGVLLMVVERVALLVLQMGLWLVPLCLVAWWPWRRTDARAFWGCVTVAVLMSAIALAADRHLPRSVFGNVWLELGIGPRTIEGGAAVLPVAWPRVLTTLLACLGTTVLVLVLWARVRDVVRGWRTDARDTAAVFAAACLVIGFGPFALSYGPMFDRHALFLIPFVMLLLFKPGAPEAPVIAWKPAVPALVLFLIVAVGGTHDYLAWQGARWRMASAHVASTSARLLDAGFEFNNYTDVQAAWASGQRAPAQLSKRSTATARIAIAAPAGAPILRRVDLDPWLPYSPRQLVLFTLAPPALK